MTDSVFPSNETFSPFTSQSDQADQTTPIHEQFLRLQIGAEIPVLFPIQQIAEVLIVPDSQVMPIPHLSASVMGVHNWRGEILWVVDLGHLCGFQPWHELPLHRSAHAAVILNLAQLSTHSRFAKGQMLGLVVQHIEEIEQFALDTVQPLPPVPVPAPLAQFSAGYWQKPDQTVLAILDSAALLSALL